MLGKIFCIFFRWQNSEKLHFFDFFRFLFIPEVTAMVNEAVRAEETNTSLVAYMMPESERITAGDLRGVHYHDGLELLVVYEGTVVFSVYGKEYSARSGEVVLINSRVLHSAAAKNSLRIGCVRFRESDYTDAELTKIIKYALRFHAQVASPVRIFSSKELFGALDLVLREADEKRASYEMFIRSGVYLALGILYREGALFNPEQLFSGRELRKILPILSYINASYSDNLSLESVSAKLGFDQSYFCRIFKNATGATFTEYINFVRICKSEKLLLKTEEGVHEIALQVGFSSVSYFNRVFKRYHGLSPRAYRRIKYGIKENII